MFRTESFLHKTEQTSQTGDGQTHAAQLANHLVPFLHCNAFLRTRQIIEDVIQALKASGRQFDGFLDGVDDPSQNCLPGSPTCIALLQLLHRDRFLTAWFVGFCQGAKHLVNGFEEKTAHSAPPIAAPLNEADEVVHKKVNGSQGRRSVVLSLLWWWSDRQRCARRCR